MHHHHFHHLLRKIFKNRELLEIDISVLIRTLALSLIGIFTPIYLYQEIGLGLKGVISYYLVWTLFLGLFYPFYAKLGSKIGYKKLFCLSIPFYLAHISVLYYLFQNPKLYWLAAALAGIATAFYDLGFNSDFARSSDKKNRASEVSKWYSLALFGTILGPLISGIIIAGEFFIPGLGNVVMPFSGFNIVFLLAATLMAISAIPLLFSKDFYDKAEFSYKYIFKKEHLKDFIGFIGIGVEYAMNGIFWPIFVFLVLGSYFSLGIITTFVGIFVIIITLIIGKLSDKYHKAGFIKAGTLIHSLTWFFRYWARSFSAVSGIGVVSNVAYVGLDIPMSAIYYDHANKTNRIEYLIMQEMGICLGRLLIIGLMALTGSYLVGFVATGFAGFAHLLFL